MRSIEQSDLKDKKILCRLDFNVPFDSHGLIADTAKIDAALPTVNYLLEKGAAKIVILSHRGQPKIYPDLSLSLQPVADYLATAFSQGKSNKAPRQQAVFAEGLNLFTITEKIFLSENVRFTQKEEANDAEFAKMLAQGFDLFVFDAFATAHRAHASTVGVCAYLPSFAGLLVEKEIANLQPIRDGADHPFFVVMGGAKVKDKLPVIENLAEKTDQFLIGGAIANTFLKASGVDVKKSLIEEDKVDLAKSYLERFGEKLHLPSDYVWDENEAIMDIGPKTIMEFEDKLGEAATVFWNGNLGKTEERHFSTGTLMIGDYLSKCPEITRVVSGGDTVGFLDQHNLADKMTFASTGGGATLEFLSGKDLPALAALEHSR